MTKKKHIYRLKDSPESLEETMYLIRVTNWEKSCEIFQLPVAVAPSPNCKKIQVSFENFPQKVFARPVQIAHTHQIKIE